MRYLAGGLALVTFCVVACSSEEWVHRYKKQDELVYDYNRCERQAETQQNSGVRSVTITPYVFQGLIDQCLQQNGWAKRTKR